MKELGTISLRLGVLAEQLDALFLHSFFCTPDCVLQSSAAEWVGEHYPVAAATINTAAHLAAMLDDQLIEITAALGREVQA